MSSASLIARLTRRSLNAPSAARLEDPVRPRDLGLDGDVLAELETRSSRSSLLFGATWSICFAWNAASACACSWMSLYSMPASHGSPLIRQLSNRFIFMFVPLSALTILVAPAADDVRVHRIRVLRHSAGMIPAIGDPEFVELNVHASTAFSTTLTVLSSTAVDAVERGVPPCALGDGLRIALQLRTWPSRRPLSRPGH